jgi:hypothetical protein
LPTHEIEKNGHLVHVRIEPQLAAVPELVMLTFYGALPSLGGIIFSFSFFMKESTTIRRVFILITYQNEKEN